MKSMIRIAYGKLSQFLDSNLTYTWKEEGDIQKCVKLKNLEIMENTQAKRYYTWLMSLPQVQRIERINTPYKKFVAGFIRIDLLGNNIAVFHKQNGEFRKYHSYNISLDFLKVCKHNNVKDIYIIDRITISDQVKLDKWEVS